MPDDRDRSHRQQERGHARRSQGIRLPSPRVGQAFVDKDRSQPPAHRLISQAASPFRWRTSLKPIINDNCTRETANQPITGAHHDGGYAESMIAIPSRRLSSFEDLRRIARVCPGNVPKGGFDGLSHCHTTLHAGTIPGDGADADFKSEFCDGFIIAMAGGNRDHRRDFRQPPRGDSLTAKGAALRGLHK